MDPEQLHLLMAKYLDGSASPAETEALHDWYRSEDPEMVSWPSGSPDEGAHVEARMLDRLQRDIHGAGARVIALKRRTRGVAAAVVILCLLSGATYYWWKRPLSFVDQQATLVALNKNDITPGGNKAKLILSNGRTITLDSAGNGLVAQQGNAQVEKTGLGELAYEPQGAASAYPGLIYNTIITPLGGTFSVTLSDGTRVWLNAGSSIRYPAIFTGAARSVELKGEAYFEVAPHAAMPFSVVTAGQTIRVLGTHFNVNAYDNEPAVKTTLLEGQVKVAQGTDEVLLRPGQQSVATGREIRVVGHIDTSEVMAWKNGMFQFDEADISTVMRQVGRWYDVQVIFEGKLPADHFRGKIPRNVNASQVLQILALSGIDFKIEGKKIILK